MKKKKWNRLAAMIFILSLVAGNLLSVGAFASVDEDPVATNQDDPPPGVLKGYIFTFSKVKSGEHIEHFGWIGGEFIRVVTDYKIMNCCMKTNRAMDGCANTLPICEAGS